MEGPSQSAEDTIAGVEPYSSGRETAAYLVLVRLKRSGPASLAAESAATAPTGDLPSIGSP